MLEGNCHCRGVSWTLGLRPEYATACNCTICRRYGALWAYGYLNQDISVSGETTVYRRTDGGDIGFHFCPRCGCVTHYTPTPRKKADLFKAAVNLRMVELGPIETLSIRHFDGHDTWEDLPGDGRTVKDLWF